MILIIDVPHIYYRYWYTRDKFAAIISRSGRNIAHVKAALDACVKIIDDAAFHYDADELTVFACLDRGGLKQDMFPEYKANRQSQLDDDNRAEIAYIANALARRGVVVLAADGYEADDLVYTIARKLGKGKDGEEIVIYSSDADLLMHVAENVDVRILRQKQYLPVTKKLYVKQLGFICKRDAWYNDIVLYKSCVGDSSDNIKGVRGFGDVTYKKRMALIFEQSKEEFEGIVPSDPESVLAFAQSYLGFTPAQIDEFTRSLGMVYPLYHETLELPVQKIPVSQLIKAPARAEV
jgi:5'-3' exonuclease